MSHDRPTAYIVTLGCAKNTVDSEYMAGLLRDSGFRISRQPTGSDLVVLNTCGFIGDAKEESLAALESLLELKAAGQVRSVVAAGCLVQRYPRELREELPEIDALIGTGDFERIGEVGRQLLRDVAETSAARGQCHDLVGLPQYRYEGLLPRFPLESDFSAYVKISEGCDHSCAFCAIPIMRGRFRSRPAEVIEREVRSLVEQGAREINLIAQDSTSYGLDVEGKLGLPSLLRRLDHIDGVDWIRVHYAYPTLVTEDLAAAIADSLHVVHYLDMPLQHGSDRILARMRRAENRALIEEKVDLLRREIPDLVLRSTFIVGFPGEGRDDFAALLDLLQRLQLDRVGFFAYSREEGTMAFNLDGQVPALVQLSRLRRAQTVQERVSLERQQRWLGAELPVYVEGPSEGNPGYWRGRWWGQAPEVDGEVIFAASPAGATGPAPCRGDKVRVLIQRAEASDLLGVQVG